MSTRKITSTNSINREKLIDFCGMMYAVDLLGGRWKLIILYKLGKGPLRFSELKRIIPGITDRMLTLHLKELEQNDLINRTVYAEVPPRVDYRLSSSAELLIPVWQQLEQWGLTHKQNQAEKKKL
ncbi:winged helix-turn-helix transcriptional regulator [Mucilaginibacter sp. RCC_168]|jgi:DNA-binding HxlR family transcriptional regulator|uniref:winged helix-turn-helix transcriptional regulator n=1 Tax=Mucilaginibacter sp. RCC_168 TaxID=3239221 RepID=UPI003525768C